PSPPVDREAFRERIVVTEVLLDVLVTDKSGKVVTGLGPQDFVIEERDQVFAPTSVTFYGGAELEASGAGGGTRSDRYFILLFHDQTQSAPFLIGHQLDAGRWTKRWIDQELRPNDQVAVLAYDVKLKLYQDFTREKESLKRAVDAAVTGKRAPDRFETLSAPELDPDSPSLSINLPADRDLSRSTRKVEQALSLLGHAAEGIAGRKNLLLFSVGFGEVGQSGMWTPDPRYYPDMEQSLNDGNVAVYSIDLISTSRGSPRERAINDALSSISNDTGGRYYYAFANPLAPLRQIAEDNLGYYLISYQTDYEAGTAGYREVRVKVRSGAYTVRARRGYRYGS
ncbi:MAG TPA: VWA domain-containing protein, partial [Thermoanaerobaculia bacterium]|nr:VWA domain-containing protein [Thermoanaerobaculia bacterium]